MYERVRFDLQFEVNEMNYKTDLKRELNYD